MRTPITVKPIAIKTAPMATTSPVTTVSDAARSAGIADATAAEAVLICDAADYLKDIQKLEKDHIGLLEGLGDLSNLDILDIGYDD